MLHFNVWFWNAVLSPDHRPPPEFLSPLPIRKTRAGLQFTCAAPTVTWNSQYLRDVWVCNSDGYVGQVTRIFSPNLFFKELRLQNGLIKSSQINIDKRRKSFQPNFQKDIIASFQASITIFFV